MLEHWVSEVRPVFGPGSLGALWVTERASRMVRRSLKARPELWEDAL
jgi:hypothetical protein